MSEKKCKKCGEVKPLTDYYTHPSPKDGHLGHCKSCHKIKTDNYRKLRRQEVDYVISERESNRKRMRERRTLGIDYQVTKESKAKTEKKYRESNPLKAKAKRKVATAIENGSLISQPCEKCGDIYSQAHHDSYLEENWLNVRWLCPKHHAEHHALMRDQQIIQKFNK